MSDFIYFDQKDNYDLLVVREDMLTVKGVVEEVIVHIQNTEEPLRIEVHVSYHNMKDVGTFSRVLDRVDRIATKNYVPVLLSICPCCIEALFLLLTDKRWRSRWKPR